MKHYKLKIVCKDGLVIISPPIAPNNPSHDYTHKSIANVIDNTGMSMMKRLKDVAMCECVVE